MSRSFWIGALAGMLIWAPPGWTQSSGRDWIVKVPEVNGPVLRCRVLKFWREKDGSKAYQVQDLETLELITIRKSKTSSPGSPVTTETTSIFHGAWDPPPPDVPAPPPDAVVIATPISSPSVWNWMFKPAKTQAAARPSPAPRTKPVVVKINAKSLNAQQAPAGIRDSAPAQALASAKTKAPIALPVVSLNPQPPNAKALNAQQAPPAQAAASAKTKAPIALPVVSLNPEPLPSVVRWPPPTLPETWWQSWATDEVSPAEAASKGEAHASVHAKEVSPTKQPAVSGNLNWPLADSQVLLKPHPDATPRTLPASSDEGALAIVTWMPTLDEPAPTGGEKRSPAAAAGEPPLAGELSLRTVSEVSAGTETHREPPLAQPKDQARAELLPPARRFPGNPDRQPRSLPGEVLNGVSLAELPTNSHPADAASPAPVRDQVRGEKSSSKVVIASTSQQTKARKGATSVSTPTGTAKAPPGDKSLTARTSLVVPQTSISGPVMHPLDPPMEAGDTPAAATASRAWQTNRLLGAMRNATLPSERQAAVERLSSCKWQAEPNVVPEMLQAAKNDRSPAVRASCVRALAKMKANTPEVVQTVQAMKEDADIRVRQEVLLALAVLTAVGN